MRKKRNITIDDIAADLGVSKTTVSRAISGKGRISDTTKARVLAYINETNYRPSAAAKSLAESKTYNLALVLPKSLFRMDTPFIRKSMSAICEEAFLQGYNILLCLSTDDNPASLLRMLDDRKVDGVILSRTVENDSLVDLLTQREMPFATMGSLPASRQGLATVEADHDHIGGCCAFTTAFLGKDRQAAALFGNDMQYIVNQSRFTGFCRGLEALGLSENQCPLFHTLDNYLTCAQAVDDALQQGIHRFLAMDEEVCANILYRLRERSLRIPEDVQVGSFADSEQLAAYTPGISALSFDAAELGRVVCRELLQSLRAETYDPTPTLGYRIRIRDSF